MEPNKTITIAVVDDHPLVRDGMRDILMQMGFSVIIQAEHGEHLLSQLSTAPVLPDLCLLDINMPIMNGMETTIAMKQQWPAIKIIGYTFNTSQADAMLESGADACLQKCRSALELKKTIIELINIA